MSLQNTRLEWVVVGTVFLVLLLCRQPPKSGNAGVRVDLGRAPEAAQSTAPENTARQESASLPLQTTRPPSDATLGNSSASQPRAADQRPDLAMPDNPRGESAVSSQPRPKRMAVVDARRCDGLKYKDLMYGEVTVRWVWNGGRLVPEKVCQVTEPSGVVTTWSFDNPDVIISELPPDTISEN
jgi:hypothetical protein